MESPFITLLSLVATAYAGRFCFKVWGVFKASKTTTAPPKNFLTGFKSPMTKKEAALILGIGQNAAKDKVKEAHRRLIVKNHPDTGGSDYLATKINQARDTLMKKT